MTRFVHTADWQLGMTRHFLAGEAQARFTAARIEAIGAIGALAAEQGCSFVVVGGDVFESNHIERQVVVRALDTMAATPGVDFYLLPGNHDPLDAAAVYRSATFTSHQPANVVVLDHAVEHSVAPGVSLLGAPWPNKRPTSDLVGEAIAELPADGTTRIVVGHGAVDTLSPDPTDPARIRVGDLEAALGDGRIAYVALGDRHSTTRVGTTGRIWYSGAPEPTDYDEIDPGNVLVVDLEPDPIAVEPHPIGTWRFVREHHDVTGAPDVGRVVGLLDELPDKPRTIVKLALRGQLSLGDMAELDRSLELAADRLGALERWDRHDDLVALPDDDDTEALGLTGFAAAALDDLRALGAGGGDEAREAREALRLLHRLARDPS